MSGRRTIARVLGFGLAAFAAAWPGALAQEPFRVSAILQPDAGIAAGQPVRLILSVEGSGQANVAPPRPGQLVNLKVIGGPDTRANSVWSNGRFSSKLQWVYTLLPERAGPAEVPAFEFTIGSQVYRTDPIRFVVQEQGRGTAPAPPPAEPRRRAEDTDRSSVSVVAQLGTDEAFVGQSVPLSVSLMASERVVGANWAKEPAFTSFWVETLEVDPEAEAYPTVLDGRRYSVIPLLRKVLVPQTAGEFEIEPFQLQVQLRLARGNDIFDFLSLGRAQTVMKQSRPLVLRVRPLPETGRPEGFGGAVGKYSLKVELDRRTAQVNDAVALKATVRGEGSLRTVGPPIYSAPTDVKVLDPKVNESFSAERGKIVSTKTWEWIVIPLAAEDVRLPEIRFPYFDPDTGSYQVARAEPPLLAVRRGGPSETPTTAHGDIQLKRRDLAYIKALRGTLREGSPRVHRSGLFLLLLFLPLAWVPLVVLLGRRRERLRRDRGLARSRRARARARRRLAAAGRRLASADGATFHEEVARALVDYVADRFDRSAAGLTYDVADELLAARGIDSVLRRRFRSCLETCDFARFVPAAEKQERRAEVLVEAGELVERLERV